MLQVARLASTELRDAAPAVADYLRSALDTDGGARGRTEQGDLYYTVFALDGLVALRAQIPSERVARYLESFGGGEGLDLVHLACLARCWAAVGIERLDDDDRNGLLERISRHRAADGGFGPRPRAERGTAYHAFLAWGAYQDLGAPPPSAAAMATSLVALETGDGGYANEPGMSVGTTPATAAAVTLLRQVGQAPAPSAGPWLLDRAHPHGGFRAAPGAPIPDLLSTATALHALAGLQISPVAVKEPCLDFVDTLWTGRGFCGSWADEEPDVEYTFYGLLALGHLSL